jgi:hypothetical protein
MLGQTKNMRVQVENANVYKGFCGWNAKLSFQSREQTIYGAHIWGKEVGKGGINGCSEARHVFFLMQEGEAGVCSGEYELFPEEEEMLGV